MSWIHSVQEQCQLWTRLPSLTRCLTTTSADSYGRICHRGPTAALDMLDIRVSAPIKKIHSWLSDINFKVFLPHVSCTWLVIITYDNQSLVRKKGKELVDKILTPIRKQNEIWANLEATGWLPASEDSVSQWVVWAVPVLVQPFTQSRTGNYLQNVISLNSCLPSEAIRKQERNAVKQKFYGRQRYDMTMSCFTKQIKIGWSIISVVCGCAFVHVHARVFVCVCVSEICIDQHQYNGNLATAVMWHERKQPAIHFFLVSTLMISDQQ